LISHGAGVPPLGASNKGGVGKIYIFISPTGSTSKQEKKSAVFYQFSTYRVRGHPRSSILVTIESACTFLLVTNSNFGRVSYINISKTLADTEKSYN